MNCWLATCQLQIPGFAGGGFVALAGTGYAAAGCAPGISHPAGQHTFSGVAHTPIRNADTHPMYLTHLLTRYKITRIYTQQGSVVNNYCSSLPKQKSYLNNFNTISFL